MSIGQGKGLVIFDHLAKTAGSSITSWLIEKYGPENVVWFRHELHQTLVPNYSAYRVACGHTYFEDQEGLNQSCRYVSLFRDPVDRVISWIYFAMSHDTPDMAETRRDCIKYLNGCEDNLCGNVLSNITNNYTEHFCKIYGEFENDDNIRLQNSLRAIDGYEIVGLYEQLPNFIGEFSRVLGHGGKNAIFPRINTTKFRPNINDVPEQIRKSIEKRNALDIEIYHNVVRRIKLKNSRRKFWFFDRTHWNPTQKSSILD